MASGAAKRYAQAVFSLAKERGTLDRWLDDMAALNDLVSDPRAAEILASPAVPEAEKLKLVDRVLAGAQPEARNLAHILIHRRRVGIVPDLAQLFGAAVLQERGIVIAEVTTAEPLGPSEQEMVRAQLSRIVGKTVQLRLNTDPSIIGGVIARVGDQLIDGSVINQLRRLRARLTATA
ncbi:MAG: F-type H+-transporting ATPase subunit delta [Thermomicrobiales bacterium]|jgi:F-type H+-transporting ATPase subunit delta|nr:F-type H+-transporting ATPase subunit delta [Thermomicrobiales bacterium]MEA2531746.1 F-type H+-transporting ATPase subunit delta [Thermomicrobiales bacterium]MEA2595109.1 F-type H+-transporting ATPase subunit delta [Thermomicrobiales bacterium]